MLLREPFRVFLLTREGVVFILDQIQTEEEPSRLNKTYTCVLARVSFIKAQLPAKFSKSLDQKIKKTFIKFNCSPCTYSMSLINRLRILV